MFEYTPCTRRFRGIWYHSMYMELLILVFSVLLASGISLGVGGSTLAVLNFFHAIKDGKIDVTERGFMGVTYTVLRVAMGIILVSAFLLALMGQSAQGDDYFTGYVAAQSLLIAILFLNSFLMTIRVMPSTFGPAIQASSWYSLGILSALLPFGIVHFNFLLFLFIYGTFLFFAISLINSIMAYLKEKMEKSVPPPATTT